MPKGITICKTNKKVKFATRILMHNANFVMSYNLYTNSKKGKAGFVRNLGMSIFPKQVSQREFKQGKLLTQIERTK